MFEIIKTEGKARRGLFSCAHGTVHTPVFMNVGTQAAIKGGLSAYDLRRINCQIELSNTYHLSLRPGAETVKALGGLHAFMNWDGPILTDSGGFQVFSLSGLRNIEEEGVTFASHIDGRRIFMRPEDSMRIQACLGADIAMAFDECFENPAGRDYAARSCGRTTRWLARCISEHERLMQTDVPNPAQQLWGINQGGTHTDIRVAHMQAIAELNLPGYAIGGLSVGESAGEMYAVIEAVEPHMPKDRPRYLMGVGTPDNILEAVWRGMDFFDCVLPARNARHGHLYTEQGVINLNNQKYAHDPAPIDQSCGCPVCREGPERAGRAYLRHLLKAGEVLGLRLCVMHNLWFYNNFFKRIREALDAGTFEAFRARNLGRYSKRV